jgi:DnaJ-domain-containing protein 1
MKRKDQKFGLERDPCEEGPLRPCDWEGCGEGGEYRAPESRDNLKSFRWFCLEHIRQYNRAWNYYEGMTEEEVEADVRRDTVWHRPSWRLGGSGKDGLHFDPSKFDDTFSLFGEERPTSEESPPPQWNVNTPEGEALAIMDLKPPLTTKKVKARYKELVKRHHPDANGGNKESEETFKKISIAYTTIIESLAS